MKWKSLLMPKAIKVENPDDVPNYGKVIVEPLERGWGHTVGNSIRRIMLSSLQGAAVISVRIENVLHEYMTIEGVVEDVTDIILNIKKLRVRLNADEDATLRLDVSGEGEVKASDIEKNPDVEILNPDLHIATINADAKLKIEMHVSDGRGYVPAEQNKREDDPVLDNSVLSLKGLHGSESGKVINTFRDLIVNVYFPEKTLQRLNVLPI